MYPSIFNSNTYSALSKRSGEPDQIGGGKIGEGQSPYSTYLNPAPYVGITRSRDIRERVLLVRTIVPLPHCP